MVPDLRETVRCSDAHAVHGLILGSWIPAPLTFCRFGDTDRNMDPLLSMVPPTVLSVCSGKTSIAIVQLYLGQIRLTSPTNAGAFVSLGSLRWRRVSSPRSRPSPSRGTPSHWLLWLESGFDSGSRTASLAPGPARPCPICTRGARQVREEENRTGAQSNTSKGQRADLSEHNRKEKERSKGERRKRRVVNPPAAALGSSRHRPLSTQPYLPGPNSIGFLRRTLATLRNPTDVP